MLSKKIIAVSLMLLSCRPIAGSAQTSDSVSNNLFSKGIYIENLHLIIPWGASTQEIGQFGNPRIIHTSKKQTLVKWDSVQILNGICANILFENYKCLLCKASNEIFREAFCFIDSIDIGKLKIYFEEYAHTQGNLISYHDNSYYYYWIIDECSVKLGYRKDIGGNLRIQKIKN